MATVSSATDVTTPSISVALAITPPEYSHAAGENTIPTLSITATLASSGPKPVTIMGWPTIFNPKLALRRRNFTAENLTRDPPTGIKLEITKGPRRPAFQRRKGTYDGKYYVTLYPGQEFVVSHPLNLVRRHGRDGETHLFEPGNTYSLGVSDEGSKVSQQLWWWGTTDEVLDEEEGPSKDVSSIVGSGNILLNAEPVRFKILDP